MDSRMTRILSTPVMRNTVNLDHRSSWTGIALTLKPYWYKQSPKVIEPYISLRKDK
jgi:hypothetical protein